MTSAGRLDVTVEAAPAERGGVRPSTWVRARLLDVTPVTGRHRDGYTFRFTCEATDVEATGTVWEPLHPGRPLHHWLTALASRPLAQGEQLDLATLAGAVVDIYCEEETAGGELQVVDLRTTGTAEGA